MLSTNANVSVKLLRRERGTDTGGNVTINDYDVLVAEANAHIAPISASTREFGNLGAFAGATLTMVLQVDAPTLLPRNGDLVQLVAAFWPNDWAAAYEGHYYTVTYTEPGAHLYCRCGLTERSE